MSIENDSPLSSYPSENPESQPEQHENTGNNSEFSLPDTLSEEAGEVRTVIQKIRGEIGKVIVGQTDVIDFLMAALITNGHVLLEGVPGVAKTLVSKLLSQCIAADFSRIQFTPDLMPSDIVGTSVFDMKRSEFYFKKGPVFSNVVLIDEVNRAPAKTQAALMEVMEEQQVTIDGITHKMPPPFFVIATQNPVEQEGTYKLPEAQLDRFMFKLKIDYPDVNEEEAMLQRFKNDFYGFQENEVKQVIDGNTLVKYRKVVEQVYIKDELLRYIAELVSNTRNNSDIYLGGSPRASINILKASKAIALLAGRGYVLPDDIKKVAYPVLNHRLIMSYEREIEGITIAEIIEGITNKLEVPR